MARHKLTDKTVRSISEPGRYSDGGNLYLRVRESGSKTFVVLVDIDGKRREVTIGRYGNSARDVSLAEARDKAADIIKIAKEGGDPTAKNVTTGSSSPAAQPVAIPTFGEFAMDLVDGLEHGFKNEKHRKQWRSTLETYCRPVWNKPVNEVTTDDVLGILKPIWMEKTVTAMRLRGRIERVLAAAKTKGLRTGENPATWHHHLSNLLPKPNRRAQNHHAALPYEAVPTFWQELQKHENFSSWALQLTILTCARSGEIRGATFDEFDLEQAVWTIPAHRMKAGRVHRVPLTPGAVELVRKMEEKQISEYLFPGLRSGRPITDAAVSKFLKGLVTDATVHGFRSSFRDWAGDETDFPRELAEAALAHTVGDETERAYRRGDALVRRRRLMEAWTDYVTGAPARVEDLESTVPD